MTNKKCVYLSLLSILLAGVATFADEAAHDQDVPVAPIHAGAFAGFTNTFQLSNARLHIVVAPDIGRILHMGPNAATNLLNANPHLAGKLPPSDDETPWLNYGGDWLWPVAQSRWPDFQQGDWPPSRLLDGRPWAGRAWKCADGTQCCLITQDFGSPLHVTVSRLIKLPPDKDTFTIHQRMERTGTSGIPMTLWHITQVEGAERVVIPLDANSAFEKGYRPMMFGPPATNAVLETPEVVVYRTADGKESKLCSDSKMAWIAARRGAWVLLEQIRDPDTDGVFPDGGCTVEMYSNAGLGYSEIETLSLEKVLQVDESIENTLYVTLRKLDREDMEDDALSALLLEWTAPPVK
ncbi:MAG: DUF4380 domain-containing protein [Spartobacteria bacterium]|nr:DUF4380 domain-containing protein [Spartobacteria bacterium]